MCDHITAGEFSALPLCFCFLIKKLSLSNKNGVGSAEDLPVTVFSPSSALCQFAHSLLDPQVCLKRESVWDTLNKNYVFSHIAMLAIILFILEYDICLFWYIIHKVSPSGTTVFKNSCLKIGRASEKQEEAFKMGFFMVLLLKFPTFYPCLIK